LVIPISEDLNLYDGLYNNDLVLSANIRRWPNDVAYNVKIKTLEIQCALVNDDSIAYSIEDLKEISTKAFAESITSTQDPIDIVLRCRKDTPSPFRPTGFRHGGWLPQESASPHMRVRVTNESSGRSKDLLIAVTEESNLFDSLYQNTAVSSGKIRKWPKELAQGVKNGTREILCVLLNQEGHQAHVFSICDLKETTTKRLAILASAGAQDPVTLVLQCREVKGKAGHDGEAIGGNLVPTMQIRISNEISENSKCLIVPIAKDLSLFDSMYNTEALKASNVRNFPKEVLGGIQYNTHEIKCVLFDKDGHESHVFAIDDLADTSTMDLFERTSKSEGPIKLVLRAQRKISRLRKPPVDYSSLSYMRVQITNEATERVKALVLPVSKELNLYEAMYDNTTVKSSYISEMPDDIVQALKRKQLEVKCILLDDDGGAMRAFSLTELKRTSTKDIYELTEQHEGVIYFALRCYTAV
jgi:hypothetical protein